MTRAAKKPRKRPVPRFVAGVRLSNAGLGHLRAMCDGATIIATRRFPFDFTFALHYPAAANKGQQPLTEAAVDVLVRAGLIESRADKDGDRDVRVYRPTDRGRVVADGGGFDQAADQAEMFSDGDTADGAA